MKFDYKAKNKPSKIYNLINWQELGEYICGVDISANRYKTFLKFRIVKYLDDDYKKLSLPYPKPPKTIKQQQSTEILFTGFSVVIKKDLQRRATDAGLKVVKSVTKNCVYVVGGATAGAMKLEKARLQGCYILNKSEYFALLETGELPEDDFMDDVY